MKTNIAKPFFSILKDLKRQTEENVEIIDKHHHSWGEKPNLKASWLNAYESVTQEIVSFEKSKAEELLRTVMATSALHRALKKSYKEKGEFQGALLLGHGQEAVGTGIAAASEPYDPISPSHRDLAVYIARGTPAKNIWMNHFMRANGPSGGCDPNSHFSDLDRNILGFLVSDMAMSAVQINGAIWAVNEKRFKEKGDVLDLHERAVGIAIFGDGASSNGLAHEGMNFAKAWPLPILFVILNNQIALSTNAQQEHGNINLAKRAIGYEMPYLSLDEEEVNGDNVYAVYFATRLLLYFSRATEHPTLLHLKTFRRGGHNDSEDTSYMKQIFELDEYQLEMNPERRPDVIAHNIAIELGAIDDASYETMRQDMQTHIDIAHQEALAEMEPIPEIIFREAERDTEERIYGNPPKESHADARMPLIDPHCTVVANLAKQYPPENAGPKKLLSMHDAIGEALQEELDYDPLLISIGEDIGWPKGGIYAVTKKLVDDSKYRYRIKNVPISEGAISGFVAGAGMYGARVIGEFQFWNFFLSAPSPILTLAATRPFVQKTGIPGVFRGPTGYSPQSNHYHESWPDPYLLKSLGIKVVVPGTAEDAKGLLKSAIRDPDLVAYLEEISGYFMRDEVPEGEYFTPFAPIVRREGKDITLVTWGPKMLKTIFGNGEEVKGEDHPRTHEKLGAAKVLSKEGIELEVIDLRVLCPLDIACICGHAEKTGRIIVLHEDSKFMGFGAEIVAQIAESMTYYKMRARLLRVAALNTPIPANLNLENYRLPDVPKVIRAARKLMEESL